MTEKVVFVIVKSVKIYNNRIDNREKEVVHMLFQTTSDHEALRAKIRAFAEEEIKPIAFSLDQENQFPDEAVKKLGEMGLMGIPYPKEYGGAGLDITSYAIAVEELAKIGRASCRERVFGLV